MELRLTRGYTLQMRLRLKFLNATLRATMDVVLLEHERSDVLVTFKKALRSRSGNDRGTKRPR